jgi:hypothetical protein
MHKIQVRQVESFLFEVTVSGNAETMHHVSISPDYAKKIGGESPTALLPLLVERSFEFLLAREPNTSILRKFDLSVINRYFPEYEKTIQDSVRLQQSV